MVQVFRVERNMMRNGTMNIMYINNSRPLEGILILRIYLQKKFDYI